MKLTQAAWLRHDVIAEPLVNQWYAWLCLIPPATAARYLTHAQIPVMSSFIEAPDVHAAALRDPEMIGGPFIQYGAERVPEIRDLLQRMQREQWLLTALSRAIDELDRILAAHPKGEPLNSLYPRIPEPLRGFVELVYDARNCPAVRYQEGLLYRSDYYRPDNQTVALRRMKNSDQRAFVMSTPRLQRDIDVSLTQPFNAAGYDRLFAARHQPVIVGDLAEDFGLSAQQKKRFTQLFDIRPPQAGAARYGGPGLRVRYLGHACVLLETAAVAILVDPLVSYDRPTETQRYSYRDLPPYIDYVLITHHHQDHVMLETLLQIRHKIGQIIVPAGHRGNLLEPSLRLFLQQLGFERVAEIDRLDHIAFDDGQIISLPFLGEHGDLDIAAKTAWRIEACGRSVVCVADSDNLDEELYRHLAHLFPKVDILFIGMECEGAPYTWSYGPLLAESVSHRQAQSRRLNGSDASRATALIASLQPQQVYVYAMGQEPWLNYITSIHYTEESLAIVESNKLVQECQQRGINARRLYGQAEFRLDATARTPVEPSPIPLTLPTLQSEPEQQAVAAPVQASQAEPPEQRQADTDCVLNQLLDELHLLNVHLSLAGQSLKINAPKGTLDARLTERIKQHKPALISLLKHGAPSASEASISQPATTRLPEDACLPVSVQPPETVATNAPRHILLTGATGFIGAFLLDELLRQTEADIYCLLHHADKSSPFPGLPYLQQALSRYGLWRDAAAQRLHPVAGNLASPGLGLNDNTLAQLAEQIDCIYHSGARVHHITPYERLRATNVGGTLELVKLACRQRTKALHFISSLSVLPPAQQASGRIFRESDPLTLDTLPAGGYNRSKWMAEQLVRQARDRGLPVTIMRPGPIAGDSRNGAFNQHDFLYRLLQGYLELGLVPEGDMPLDLLPVDYLAKAVVYLSRHPSAQGGTFHLLHPQPVSSELLFAAIAEAGYRLQRVPYRQWHRALQQIAAEQPEHALYPLASLFASRPADSAPGAHAFRLPYATARTQALLAQAPFPLPALDRKLFSTYLQAMQREGKLTGVPA